MIRVLIVVRVLIGLCIIMIRVLIVLCIITYVVLHVASWDGGTLAALARHAALTPTGTQE